MKIQRHRCWLIIAVEQYCDVTELQNLYFCFKLVVCGNQYREWYVGYISDMIHPFPIPTYITFAADHSELKHIVCTSRCIETTQLPRVC